MNASINAETPSFHENNHQKNDEAMNDTEAQKKSSKKVKKTLPTLDQLKKNLKTESEKMKTEKERKRTPTKSDLLEQILPELKKMEKDFTRKEIVRILGNSGLSVTRMTLNKVLGPSRKTEPETENDADEEGNTNINDHTSGMMNG